MRHGGAVDFKLVKNDLSDATLAGYAGKVKILNVAALIFSPVAGTWMFFNSTAITLLLRIVVAGVVAGGLITNCRVDSRRGKPQGAATL